MVSGEGHNFSKKKDSGSQRGTNEWSMNVTPFNEREKRTKRRLHNAYKEFSDSLMTAAVMTHFNLKKFDGMSCVKSKFIITKKKI